ncbi:protein CREG1-like, partial [Passer montanus]|uniref:protein CREG1-like n=1 Tax=Passer montanus TaxID=9160 RepID=UPI001961A753
TGRGCRRGGGLARHRREPRRDIAASGLLLAAVAAIPPPEEAARMARYVLHSCDWGALATLSAQEGLRGRPFANIFSLSDGPPGPCGGSGVPYLYLTDMEISVQDLEVSGDTAASRRSTQGYRGGLAGQCDSAGSLSHGISLPRLGHLGQVTQERFQ